MTIRFFHTRNCTWPFNTLQRDTFLRSPRRWLVTREINSWNVMDGDRQIIRRGCERVEKRDARGMGERMDEGGKRATIQKEGARATWNEGEAGRQRRRGSKSIKCSAWYVFGSFIQNVCVLPHLFAYYFFKLLFVPLSRRQSVSETVFLLNDYAHFLSPAKTAENEKCAQLANFTMHITDRVK